MRTILVTLLPLLLAVASHAQAGGKETAKIRHAADAAVASGDWTTAVASFRELVEADPKDARAWHMLGYSLHAKGDLDEALKAHVKAAEFHETAPIATYNAACVHALRFARSGDPADKEEALKWLARAAKVGFAGAEHMRSDSDMDSLRSDPRYREIAAEVEKNATSSANVQVYAGSFDRKLARLVVFSGQGSAGALAISYGQPRWQERFDEIVRSEKFRDQRWRFGKDEWTTLTATVPLEIAGKELPAGIYYLTLAHRDPEFVLAALDPNEVHARSLDPYMARMTTGGIEVALKHERVDEIAERLEIRLVESMGSPGAGELVVRFGPHKLSAPFALRCRAGKDAAK
ncbi:MAG TPA: tetratricopeptide repeat protein [Planctomycetota bacterium]|nr:tetratricopeptide repeat protein [Planctomycetota bacterium]